MTHIKVCGITNLPDALACVQQGVNYLGFVFYEKSPRYVSPPMAGWIIRQLPQTVVPVGVFVDSPVNEIMDITATAGIRVAQLSGDETPAFCSAVPISVIKVIRGETDAQVRNRMKDYPVFAHMLDGATGQSYGGSGQTLDFARYAEVAREARLFIAGGLKPGNVSEAIRLMRPFAVDASSGLELSPRAKDHEKIRQFCSTVQLTDHQKE